MELLLTLILVPGTLTLGISKAPSPCRPDLLAVYKLTLTTNWNEDTFPKQYPLWRPPAQWSKTVGFSHTDQFSLFSLGKAVGEGVKQFVETGDSTGVDGMVQNRSLLDSFTAAPILQGAGNTTARIFLDGRHTMVSLLTKLVPSPDWFIGLDSLDLCQGGRFLDSLMLEADPLDAGTDNGFTFTSPNWPTEPRGVAFRVTSTYPPHPAGSFHYPHLDRLPSIATFLFIKDAEYSLSQQFTNVMDRSRFQYDVTDRKKVDGTFNFIPMEASRRKRKLAVETSSSTVVAASIPSQSPGGHTSSAAEMLRRKFSGSKLELPLGSSDKAELYQTILRSYPDRSLARGRRKRLRGDKRQRRHREKKGKAQDCLVSQWGPWGPCSKTCDIGETIRSRTVSKASRRGGRVCPKLTQYKWCGSARNCKEEYFDW